MRKMWCRWFGHRWRYQAIGDPSIGGTMVSRYFQCSCCGKEDLETYYYDERALK